MEKTKTAEHPQQSQGGYPTSYRTTGKDLSQCSLILKEQSDFSSQLGLGKIAKETKCLTLMEPSDY